MAGLCDRDSRRGVMIAAPKKPTRVPANQPHAEDVMFHKRAGFAFPAAGPVWGSERRRFVLGGVVRECLGPYAVEGAWSELPDEVHDSCTASVGWTEAVRGLEADRALGGG